MNQIFAQLFYEMEKHRDTVLVTLIDAAGSAPRKSGSQMLVGANGRLTGTIGGGAVERRSEEMAMALLREKRSAVHDFLLHTAASGGDIGMVCGGDVTAHFQFIPAEDASWQALASALTERLTAHQRGWLVLREDGGCGALLGPEGLLWGDLPEGVELTSLQVDCIRRGGVFSMPLPIGERALLFGAGHISQALCPLLVTVGFRPVVFDCRPELATRKLFPTRGLHLHQGPPHGDGGGLRGHHDQRPYARLPCGGADPPWAVCLCGGHRLPHQDRLREPEAAGGGHPGGVHRTDPHPHRHRYPGGDTGRDRRQHRRGDDPVPGRAPGR